jgi:ATP-binding protein involved in chromosome partitioning
MRVFRDGATAAGDENPGGDRYAGIRANLESVRNVIALGSARGGTGKSAILVNLAAALALAGRKVGIVDADLNSPSVLAMLGMRPPRGIIPAEWIYPNSGPLGVRVAGANLLPDLSASAISFVDFDNPTIAESYNQSNGRNPAEMGYSAGLEQLLSRTRFGALDFLLVDLPPGIEAFARIMDLVSRTALMVVSHPSDLSARANKPLVDLAHERRAPVLGIVENMAGFSCDSCHSVRPLMPQGGVTALAGTLNVPVLERLPFDPRFAEACDRGVIFIREYAETPLAKQVIAIAHAVDRGNLRAAGAVPPAAPQS